MSGVVVHDVRGLTSTLGSRSKSISAPGKSKKPPSIPSKYQTFIFVNNEKKGFNARSCRFSDYDYLTDNPGPGTYVSKTDTLEDLNKPGWSRKGLGSFASTTKRFHYSHHIDNVGPTSYSPALPKDEKIISSVFQKPIAVGPIARIPLPAPAQYNPVRPVRSVPAATSSFKSRTRRTLPSVRKGKAPGPGSYDISDEKKRHVNPISSVFKSKVDRIRTLVEDFPGPGTYDPDSHNEAETNPLFRLHYLAISAPAMPIPKPRPSPGPGAYNINDYKDPVKQAAASANFLSTLPRGTSLQPYNDSSPGPAAYKPLYTSRNKSSFIYNFKGRWI